MKSTKIKLLGSGPPKLPDQDNVRTRAFEHLLLLKKLSRAARHTLAVHMLCKSVFRMFLLSQENA